MTAEPKPWQNGYDLLALRALADPFKAAAEGRAFGAFGVPNERSVAEALRRNRLQFGASSRGGPPVAAAIAHILERGSRHHDFAGREWAMEAGHLFVPNLGAVPGAEGLAGKLLAQLAAPAPVAWVEVFEENRALVEAVKAQGFGWWATKIAASSDLRGVYRRPALPFPIAAAELAGLSRVRARFASRAELQAIAGEVRAWVASAAGKWEQHYSTYNKRRSWQAFALRGFRPDEPGFIEKPAEMARSWREAHPADLTASCEATIAAEHFPLTMELAGRIPGNHERLRFMRLTPGGELTRHADITNRDAGVADGKLVRLHLPIASPPECQFQSWGVRGERIAEHLAPGGLYYLDQRKPHAVQNPSDQERIHLVLDVEATSWHRDAIARGRLGV